MLHEGGSDVILSTQGVGRDQDRVGASGSERAGQVGRFSGDVGTGDQAKPSQWLLHLEALPNRTQNRHVPFRPLNSALTLIGEREVLDVILHEQSSPFFRASGLKSGIRAETVSFVGLFPAEGRFVTTEVTVGGRLSIDRAPEVEGVDDSLGSQIEVGANDLC